MHGSWFRKLHQNAEHASRKSLLVNPQSPNDRHGKQMTTMESRAVGKSEVILSAAKRHLRLVGGAPYLVIGGVNGMVTRPGSCGGLLAASALAKTRHHTVEQLDFGHFFIPRPGDYLKQRRK